MLLYWVNKCKQNSKCVFSLFMEGKPSTINCYVALCVEWLSLPICILQMFYLLSGSLKNAYMAIPYTPSISLLPLLQNSLNLNSFLYSSHRFDNSLSARKYEKRYYVISCCWLYSAFLKCEQHCLCLESSVYPSYSVR